MSDGRLIPHALWHRQLDIIITLEKVAKLDPSARQAWKEADTELLYRLEESDSAQLSLDLDGPLDLAEVSS
jgi:hypothetical protein